MKLPISYFDSKMTGDIMQRINDNHRIEAFLTGSSLNTLFSAFNFITKQFPNIKLLQKESPHDCADWSQPIDVYFEDALHANPLLNSNIQFWSNHIKPNGFIIGHDYNQLCPDVMYEFNKLIQSGWRLITKVDSLIVLQKPNTAEGNN
jgi:hypothetical protein